MTAYYNENDSEKAACLRQFIADGLIAPGEVDERSIKDVRGSDLRGFAQCHFFAGFGFWSYALRLAGWPDSRSVWTGSCPCPSFSAAGKGQGFDDPRHLWPDWSRLIGECKPPAIFGEQADDAIGYGWLDLVQTDLERAHYAVGKAVLGACSVGAPHIRQRLYFVGHLEHSTRERQPFRHGEPSRELQGKALPEELRLSDAGVLVFTDNNRRKEGSTPATASRHGNPTYSASGTVRMGDGISTGLEGHDWHGADGHESRWFGAQPHGSTAEAGYLNGFWRDADWVLRKRWNRDDSEWCPTEPGLQQMADGSIESMGRIHRQIANEAQEEILNVYSSQGRAREALSNLWEAFAAQAIQRKAGRLYGFYQAPVLLAFLRQLSIEGWPLAQSLPCAGTKKEKGRVRSVRCDIETSCSSCGRELDEQRVGECTDALHLLSSILARYAQKAWTEALNKNAGATFPLASGVKHRVLKIRGYGDAIVPQVAAQFILAAAHPESER